MVNALSNLKSINLFHLLTAVWLSWIQINSDPHGSRDGSETLDYRHHSDDLSSLENLNELFLLPNQILRQIFIHTTPTWSSTRSDNSHAFSNFLLYLCPNKVMLVHWKVMKICKRVWKMWNGKNLSGIVVIIFHLHLNWEVVYLTYIPLSSVQTK